jgi:lysophospholipase L1-like esterase
MFRQPLSSTALVIALAGVFGLTSPSFAQAPTAPEVEFTADDSERLAAARAAIMKTPEMRAATAKFNASRKAFQEDRQKFPADRNKEVAVAFRKATAEYEQAKQQALLASDPALRPLLEREAAAKKAGSHPNEGETVADSDSPKNAAVRPVKEVPGLPRVLLIGDSISIGYTLEVRKLLEGKANVQRIPVNGGATEYGLANMKKWLGSGKWDVVHFNFGLHDSKRSSETEFRASRDQYAENLRKLVSLMKPTGARLIFATTTPVPNGGVLSPTRVFDDIQARNEIARRVMDENGVAIDDLYAVALPRLAEVGRPKDVHFQPQGYELLAKAVAASIEAELPKK